MENIIIQRQTRYGFMLRRVVRIVWHIGMTKDLLEDIKTIAFMSRMRVHAHHYIKKSHMAFLFWNF